jgi:hypothetical protein
LNREQKRLDNLVNNNDNNDNINKNNEEIEIFYAAGQMTINEVWLIMNA